MKKLLIIVAAVLALPAYAATSIKIGKLTYVGTSAGVSTYTLDLNATGITIDPIPFKEAILFVKATKANTLSLASPITTGNGCGIDPSYPPCEISFEGGPTNLGYTLSPCAKTDNVTQTCISIAVQLLSTTGKNFSFTLVDGTKFCAYAINNTYVLAAHKAALDPQCNSLGFCVGVSAPVILQTAPTTSCN